MSDDLSKKIKQITDILGQDSVPDNLKGLLTLLAGSGSKQESSSKPGETQSIKEEEKSDRSELEENIEMVRKIKKVIEKVKSNSDPGINLLSALRPFLNNTRQRKVNDCIKLIHMSGLSKYVDEYDK